MSVDLWSPEFGTTLLPSPSRASSHKKKANTGDMRQYTGTVVKVSAHVRCMGSASDDTHTHTVPYISCVDYPSQTDGHTILWSTGTHSPTDTAPPPKMLESMATWLEISHKMKCLHTCATGGLSSRSTSCWNPYTL